MLWDRPSTLMTHQSSWEDTREAVWMKIMKRRYEHSLPLKTSKTEYQLTQNSFESSKVIEGKWILISSTEWSEVFNRTLKIKSISPTLFLQNSYGFEKLKGE